MIPIKGYATFHPLKHCAIGSGFKTEWFKDLQIYKNNKIMDPLKRIAEETEEDYQALEKILKDDIPYGASVQLEFEEAASGWNAPESHSWILEAIDKASKEYFNQMPCTIGEGGTIPFMAMLGEQFPRAQFVITGVLGPNSNAHGPNEFLHIPYAKKLTCCIASIINDFS